MIMSCSSAIGEWYCKLVWFWDLEGQCQKGLSKQYVEG